MSARKRRVILGPRAINDYDDILLYTKLQWGDEQRDAYEEELIAAFESLAMFSHMGSEAPELGKGVRSLLVKRHIILFHVTTADVHVARIVHERQDLRRALGQ